MHKHSVSARLETIACNLCGCNTYKHYDSEENWNIVQCEKCEFCFTNPRPILEDLHLFYAEEYFKDEYGSVKGIENKEHYKNRIEDVEEFVNQRGSVLEIGAARGEFLKTLQSRGWDVHGLEISQDAVNMAKQIYNLDLVCGTIESYTAEKQFDVICMYQTLEHVPYPSETIAKCYSMLKKGGVLIVEVPNLNCFESKFSRKRKILSYDLPRHLNHFTPQLLKKKFEEIGFEKTSVKLYVDELIVSKMLSVLRSENKNLATENNAANNNNNPSQTTLPLAKSYKSSKTNLIEAVNELLPGWRFTIYGIK